MTSRNQALIGDLLMSTKPAADVLKCFDSSYRQNTTLFYSQICMKERLYIRQRLTGLKFPFGLDRVQNPAKPIFDVKPPPISVSESSCETGRVQIGHHTGPSRHTTLCLNVSRLGNILPPESVLTTENPHYKMTPFTTCIDSWKYTQQ